MPAVMPIEVPREAHIDVEESCGQSVLDHVGWLV